MDLLIWSVNAKQTLEERRRLASAAARAAQAAERRHADGRQRRGHAQALLRQAHALPHQGDEQRHRQRTGARATGASTPLQRARCAHTAVGDRNAARATPTTRRCRAHRGCRRTGALARLQRRSPRPPSPGARTGRGRRPAPVDEDTEPAAAPPEFAAVTIQNPFGEGEIEVEEISMSDLPPGGGAPAATATRRRRRRRAQPARQGSQGGRLDRIPRRRRQPPPRPAVLHQPAQGHLPVRQSPGQESRRVLPVPARARVPHRPRRASSMPCRCSTAPWAAWWARCARARPRI